MLEMGPRRRSHRYTRGVDMTIRGRGRWKAAAATSRSVVSRVSPTTRPLRDVILPGGGSWALAGRSGRSMRLIVLLRGVRSRLV